MKPVTVTVLATLLVLFTCSCNSAKPLKQVRWHDYTFQLSVLDGGPLTSDSWEVTARHTGLFGVREKLLFDTYGGPDLTDIQLEGAFLVLLADNYDGKPKRIALDLRQLDAFLQSPVRYQRYSLMQSNASYIEPDFIKTGRMIERTAR
ncbi:hypothetical protein HNQ93_003492 [Hymenobacter luteus]|uniref:Uncharacterized protein n=2 Tax=Hymenobacter TaxID=89966 RepID=A0A7W9T4K0_9BACT|nr:MULTISPECIES: hypothetical protein [Hymenobacter]MBB4602727.1 hypothetical protein [Hymenobacter latericoloratus]MBB6060618.1 hypothetical protein [Hymenobacter luteus]